MNKIAIIIFVAVILLGGGIFIYISQTQEAEIRSGELSERAQEYLKDRHLNEESSLKNVALNKDDSVQDVSNQPQNIGNCFKIIIPFKVDNYRQEKDCMGYFATVDPKGTIVVYTKKDRTTSVDDVPGVYMRKTSTEKYEQEEKVIQGKTFLVFRNMEEFYEKSIFLSLGEQGYFVLNVTLQDDRDAEAKIDQMLQSLVITQ